MMRQIFFLAIFFGGLITLFGQRSPEFMRYKEQYPDAHVVRLQQESHITVAIEKEGVSIRQEQIEEDLYLDDTATYGSKKSLDFSTFVELEAIEASSFVYENGNYKELKIAEFKEKDELNDSFYDDTKSINFIYPNLKEGSKSRLEYSRKINNPRFLSPLYFGDYNPIEATKYTITADKEISFRFQEFNTEKLDINFSKKEKKGKIIYTWEVTKIPEFDYESDAPDFRKVLPHIIPIIESYTVNGTSVNLHKDTADLYTWYYSLVKDVNKGESEEDLVKIVETLTKDKTTDFEKVKAIYYWTQQNIKYVAFEYALGGFVPREANSVFQKKYGDCKDNSSILYEMLKIAGIKGHLTWIGTRSIPYSYSEVPTPAVDNHMILAYKDGDRIYFLDATGRFNPITLPSSFIQGKEALIALDEKNFIIEKVPVVDAEHNAVRDETILEIKEDMLVGKAKTTISGYRKIDYLYALENETTQPKKMAFYNRNLRKGNNKFLIETLEEKNKEDYDTDLEVAYQFNIKDYFKQFGSELFLNLNLYKTLSDFKTKKDRKNEIEYDYKSLFDYHTKLMIPEGYRIEYIPDNFEVSNDYLSCKITYEPKDGHIDYHHTIKLNFINLTVAEQKEVNAMIETVEKSYKEIVILRKL